MNNHKIKKIFSALISLVLASNMGFLLSNAENIVGDINEDGKIDNSDLVSLGQYLIGAVDNSVINLNAADVTGDGNVDVADLALMKQYLMGDNVDFVEGSNQITLNDIPLEYKESLEWIWNNRVVRERSTDRLNLIFDQIYAGKGTLNYVVRWQSSLSLTLQQRKDMEKMLNRQVNNWTKHLVNYDGWKYEDIKVKVVGWAVADKNQIIDKQDYEKIYTETVEDGLNIENSAIPKLLPYAPNAISRFENFMNKSYVYPNGYENRFDMYLWGTSSFGGGAGGDWGQRVSDVYILNSLNNEISTIIEHEMGHGFGLTDFYGEDERPPSGFPEKTIMWAGNSPTITSYDVWMLRYVWTMIKDQSSRFN